MKKYRFLNILFFVFSVVLVGCEEDNFNDTTTEPLQVNPDLLQGSWVLTNVIQVDQDAVDNGFPVEVQQKNITDLYNWSETTITFNLDSEGNPDSFAVDAGSAPSYIIQSGEWSVDHPVFTTQIDLFNPTLTSSSQFIIEKITESKISARIQRVSVDDIVFIRYDVEFTR